MLIKSFLLVSLSLVGAFFGGLGRTFAAALEVVGTAWRFAFPPDPLHLPMWSNWRLGLGRAVAPFLAFLDRAKRHSRWYGGNWRPLPFFASPA